MSFGFSIGDIVLLSKLAYDLYSSITVGRKGASRDLKELEDVLFSLRCALDHLSEVAKDVLVRTDNRYGGSDLRENLNRMISSCGSTLQELDDVTKKYRDIAIEEGKEDAASIEKRKKTLDDVARRIKVNWKKVRWDQEKQSLQQYREKLRSHTEAINLILSSIIWSNANIVESNSKTNHEKTHSLLNKVLTDPQTDTSLHQLVQEIHAILSQPKPKPNIPNVMPQIAAISPAEGFVSTSNLKAGMAPRFPVVNRAAISASMPRHLKLIGAIDDYGSPTDAPSISYESNTIDEAGEPSSFMACDAYSSPLHGVESTSVSYKKHSTVMPYRQREETDIASEIISLNMERRAFAAKEFEAFKKRHVKPTKPAFLSINTPDLPQLRAGMDYIFRAQPGGKTEQVRVAIKERQIEITRWTEGFHQFTKTRAGDREKSGELVELLVSLNAAVERSNDKMRQMFYEASDKAGFIDAIEQLQESSKSVRIMKEIEEFQDAREDWDDEKLG